MRGKETIASITALATLTFGACSPDSNKASVKKSNITPETTQVNDPVIEGLMGARADLEKNLKVKIMRGVCMIWPTVHEGFAITLNPGISGIDDKWNTDKTPFILFSRSRSDPFVGLMGPDIKDVQLMNGPMGEELDLGKGSAWGGVTFKGADVISVGEVVIDTVTVKPELEKGSDGRWSMIDTKTGDPIIKTAIVPGHTETASILKEICGVEWDKPTDSNTTRNA